ncbi:MAG: SH3 domain-containing protein [Candidatus Omnitrophica bacterium]|nr:SH3 domain-containing protein [Candidatus Omnitrophota bacterium]
MIAFAETEQDKFEPVYATVSADKVNVRAGYGLNFEVLAQLIKTDEVVVIGQEYGWYKIKLPEEARCFVHKDYVDAQLVTADKLRVRAGRNLNSNVLGTLKAGERVIVLEKDGDWLRIAPPQGCGGWIKKDYLTLSEKKFNPQDLKAPPLPQEIIETSGVIEDLGKIYKRQGAHKLVEGKKTLYYLKSESIDLNLYLYDRVCVSGKLIEPSKDFPSAYPVIDVEEVKKER